MAKSNVQDGMRVVAAVEYQARSGICTRLERRRKHRLIDNVSARLRSIYRVSGRMRHLCTIPVSEV